MMLVDTGPLNFVHGPSPVQQSLEPSYGLHTWQYPILTLHHRVTKPSIRLGL